MGEALFCLLSGWFSEELHVRLLRLGGILCGYGDLVALYFLLKISVITRGVEPRVRLFTVRAFFVLNLLQLVPVRTSGAFFVLMFLVLGVPYLILAYTAVTEAPFIIRRIKERIAARS